MSWSARCANGASLPDTLARVAAEAAACRLCHASLPLGARPVFQVSETARVLVVSQAPGTKVHGSGLPFDDASGDRLRAWLSMDRETFYDASRMAFVPSGLCYPGRLPNGGDAPPRPECAPLWLRRFLPVLTSVRLTLVVGSYAQVNMLGKGAMGDRVARWREFAPAVIPLPHPSWRTTGWERKNPWFGAELLPALRVAVSEALDKPEVAIDPEVCSPSYTSLL